jgi:hypothetical protein
MAGKNRRSTRGTGTIEARREQQKRRRAYKKQIKRMKGGK